MDLINTKETFSNPRSDRFITIFKIRLTKSEEPGQLAHRMTKVFTFHLFCAQFVHDHCTKSNYLCVLSQTGSTLARIRYRQVSREWRCDRYAIQVLAFQKSWRPYDPSLYVFLHTVCFHFDLPEPVHVHLF